MHRLIIYLSGVIIFLLYPTKELLAQLPDFVWAKSTGGTAIDKGVDIKVNSNGDVFVVGSFSGTADFDPSPLNYNLTAIGSEDIFILKLNKLGNFQWVKQIGSANIQQVTAMAIDSLSNIYITGQFSGGVDFDPGTSVYNLYAYSQTDVFVCKYSGNGSLVWGKSMGGINEEAANAITLDNQLNVITSGFFKGTADFDPSSATYNLSTPTNKEIFISKLDKYGNFVWAKQMGGGSDDIGYSISVDRFSNIYSTGSFRGTADFNPASGTGNVSNLISNGSEDIYISKLDQGGNFIWARGIGGSNSDIVRSLCIDTSDQVYIAGSFQGTAYFGTSTNGANYLTSNGSNDCFLAKYNSVNGNFTWVYGFGGTGADDARGISSSRTSNYIYMSGSFVGSANDGGIPINSAGAEDMFIAKIDPLGGRAWLIRYGNTGADIPAKLSIDNSENIYTTGSYNLTVDFDYTSGVSDLTSQGLSDVFVFKINNCSAPYFPINVTPDSNMEICEGITTLSVFGSYGNFFWYDSNSLQQSIGQGSEFNTPFLNSGAHNFFVIDSSCAKSDITQITVNVNSCVGISEIVESDIEVYPNPFFDVLSIQSSARIFKIVFCDALGRELYTENVNGYNSLVKKVNTSILEKGVYLLKIHSNDGVFFHKVIKQ